MSEEIIKSLFADVPIRHPQYLTMSTLNEPVQIFEGIFTIRTARGDFECDGKIYYKWFPYCQVGFEGSIVAEANAFFRIVNEREIDLLIDNIFVGKGSILQSSSSSSFISGSSELICIGDSSVPVTEIYFPVLNLREYNGDSIREAGQNGASKGRLSFQDAEYTIELDKNVNCGETIRLLTLAGGYCDTYVGKISCVKGGMTSGSISDVMDCFNQLLFFFNGQRTGIPISIGVHNGEVVWREFKKNPGASYKFVPSWSNIYFLGDINAMWIRMREFWKDPDSKDVISTAIYWYNQVNYNTSGVEGSIILAQTALELLYNWLIVEKRRLILGTDAASLTAANKIRLLLSTLNITSVIPQRFKELNNLDRVVDAPEAFVYIRNALVHGNEEKRKKLQSIPSRALVEALHLATWYIELCILYILNYSGKYNNRTLGYGRQEGQPVPWRTDSVYDLKSN